MATQPKSTEPQFTPGPWASFQFGSSVFGSETMLGVCQGGQAVHIMLGDNDGLICMMPDDDICSNADARLIAAAPDLYAALERVLDNPAATIGGDIRAQALAAIRKARGETA